MTMEQDPLLVKVAERLCAGGACFARESKRTSLVDKSFEELTAMREAIENDPANQAEGFYKYTLKARKKLDDIYWAITNKIERERRVSTSQSNPGKLPICSPSEAESLESCITKVKEKQPKSCEAEWSKPPEKMREGCYSPFAVCRASVGCRLGEYTDSKRKAEV